MTQEKAKRIDRYLYFWTAPSPYLYRKLGLLELILN
jgi:hypothetical protein